jgi:hypothetical protein
MDDELSGSPCFLLAGSFFFMDFSSSCSLWEHLETQRDTNLGGFHFMGHFPQHHHFSLIIVKNFP